MPTPRRGHVHAGGRRIAGFRDLGRRGEALVDRLSGRGWRATIERSVPGGVDQAERDAATFFRSELPVSAAWTFGPDRARAIGCPVFSVLGTDTAPLFAEAHRRLHEWFPSCVDAVVPGVTHLLQMEATEAVADAVGECLRSASTVLAVSA